jgi:hypothetical protein
LRQCETFFPLNFPELAPHVFTHVIEPCTIFDDWLSAWRAEHAQSIHGIAMADRWFSLGLKAMTRSSRKAAVCLPDIPVTYEDGVSFPCEMISTPASDVAFPMGIGLYGSLSELVPHISVGSILRSVNYPAVGIFNGNNNKHLATDSIIFSATCHVMVTTFGLLEEDIIISDAAEQPTINDLGLPISGHIGADGARLEPDGDSDGEWEDFLLAIVGHSSLHQAWLPFDIDLLHDVRAPEL